MLCVVRCVIDPCCRSVNFKRNSSNEGYGDCELLHDVKNSTSSEMHEKNEMYEHIPLLEPRKVKWNIVKVLLNYTKSVST